MSSIAGRYTPGIFGLGWTTSWQTSLSVDSSGNVTINSGGALSYFAIQANGSYLDTDGEYGTLTQSGGVYTFTDTSGTQYVFLANGQLELRAGHQRQPHHPGLQRPEPARHADLFQPGRSVRADRATDADLQRQGFVSQVADGTGNIWTYTYDAAGHLLSVTAPGSR